MAITFIGGVTVTGGMTLNPAAANDPYFMYVPLLLNSTSTNAQTNNTFLDSSTNNFTITRNGTPTQGSVTPYWPDGQWSNYFNGSTDYLTFNFATGSTIAGDFTWECWAYDTGATTYGTLLGWRNGSSGYSGIIIQRNNNTNNIIANMASPTTTSITQTSNSYIVNQWNHVALVRSSSTVTLYVNGVNVGTTTLSGSFNPGSAYWIGSDPYNNIAAVRMGGYISNQRFVNGTAVYTGNFTPPTTPLTAITNTALLTCQSNRFRDNSANNFTVTLSGTPKVQTFQPFSPIAPYTPAAYGGSGYFPSTNTDYLQFPTSTAFAPGTGDWTVECWVYPTSGTDNFIWTQTANGHNYFLLGFNATTAYIYMAASGGGTPIYGPTTSIPLNTWNHIAFTRVSGTVRVFINGVSGTATSNTTDLSNLSYVPTIGRYSHTAAFGIWTGYISNLRYVKGTAVYTANFTPPTAPVTAISGTSLLTNFTNAGIYDAAVQNNAITVGDAQASTTQYKWSPTSMKFDGTGDYLSFASGNQFTLGTADFTIEAWIYPTSSSGAQGVLGLADGGTTGSLVFWYNFSAGKVSLTAYNGTTANSTTSVSLDTWTYIAFSRTSGSLKIFINGTLDSTVAFADNCNKTTCVVGRAYSTLNQEYFNGYIQDLRITKGLGRYTATFTAPTTAFPTQ